MVKVISPTKLVVMGRLSFANIWAPKAFGNSNDAKYSTSILLDKVKDKDAIDALNAALVAAKEEAKGKIWGGVIPPDSKLRLPLHDGDIDRPDDEAYAGKIYLNASSKDAPQIVDRQKKPIEDPMRVYSGCYANVSLNCRGYNFNGSRGVTFYLGNIQFVRDGDQLAGRTSAASDFDAIEDDDDVFTDVSDEELPDWMG